MKKNCNITKKAFSWAGLFVLALSLVLTTFSSLFTSAKAFNEDDYDVIVEDTLTYYERIASAPAIVEVKEIPSDAVKLVNPNYVETGNVCIVKKYVYFKFDGTELKTVPDSCYNHIDIKADGTGTLYSGQYTAEKINTPVNLVKGKYYCVDCTEFNSCIGCSGVFVEIVGEMYTSDTAPFDFSPELYEVSGIPSDAEKMRTVDEEEIVIVGYQLKRYVYFKYDGTNSHIGSFGGTHKISDFHITISDGVLTVEPGVGTMFNGLTATLTKDKYYCIDAISILNCKDCHGFAEDFNDIFYISNTNPIDFERDHLRSENERLNGENSSLKNENEALKTENEGLKSGDEWTKLTEKNDELTANNSKLAKANAELAEKNGALEKENASLKEENEALKEKNNELSKGDVVTQFINYLFGTELAPVYCYLIIAGAVVILVLLVTGVAFGVKRR